MGSTVIMWPRVLAWLTVGTAAVAAVMLKDVGGLLSDIQTSSQRSYGAGVFTGFRPNFLDTGALVDAIEVWRSEAGVVRGLLRWHVGIDALFFIPAFAAILRSVLRRVGAAESFAKQAAIGYLLFDELETVLSGIVLESLVSGTGPVSGSFWLVLMQLLSLLKWVVLLACAVVAIVALVRSGEGVTTEGGAAALTQARSGGAQSPPLAVGGLLLLVSIFAAMVALPAGGPLDQLPDVIREHLSEGSLGLWLLSVLGFFLFVAGVVVAGLAATSPGGTIARTQTLSNRAVLLGALGVSAVLVALAWAIDGEFRIAACAPLFLALGLYAAARVAAAAGVAGGAPPAQAQVHATTWTEPAVAWVGLVAGIVGVAWAVGIVRAAFPPLVLGIDDGAFPWWLATLGGVAGAALLGSLLQAGVTAVAAKPPAFHRVAAPLTVGVVVSAAAWLAIAPDAAPLWGSTGVVGVGFGVWALVIGTLTWLSRTRPRWDVTRCLGFGARTPWFTLLIVLGLVAGMLNKEGGYHDARLVASPEIPRYADVDTAFEEWKTAAAECVDAGDDAVPMVFAAAPGGGIRAAYWTVSVLDEMFPQPCGPVHVFAISGVSGGSVGAATWVAATGQGADARAAITEMSKDVALPRALAGLLLRDIPQPLTAITTGWDDRAALMERGWSSATNVFGTSDEPAAWSGIGDGGELDFVPVLSLNGSSVTDGCRVLVTNVARLPATEGPDCQAVPKPGNPVVGPLSGSIDPFVGLRGRDETECDRTLVDVPVTTGALLSARFPLVSPSGGLVRCSAGEETTTYVVDGGYYENSGLLSLLQIWEGVEEDVSAHNAAVAADTADTASGPLAGIKIEPWFLLVDNHYRANAKKVPPGRPLEILAPLEAKQQDVLSQTMLEQAAMWEMGGGDDPRFARISPAVHPGVEAPLGWVLSSASRADLDEQLAAQIRNPDEALETLLALLHVP